MRVLIVDTSIEIIHRLKDLISPLEFIQAVDIALNYTEASARCRNATPNVVLLDMDLPAKKSFVILSELKDLNYGTLTITMADTLIEGIKEKCLALGAYFFIDKYSEFDKVPGLLTELSRVGKGSGISKQSPFPPDSSDT
jgi:DNA-binding NarL/FixJ family response regulator